MDETLDLIHEITAAVPQLRKYQKYFIIIRFMIREPSYET